MKVKICLLDKALPLPMYQTAGSVAFDIYSRIDEVIASREVKSVPSNLIVEIPIGYFLMLIARSSLSKKGLMLPNGVGVIDRDFHGRNDEIRILLYNFSERPVQIKRGERLAQGLILGFQKVEWEEVEILESQSRGGFGTTG